MRQLVKTDLIDSSSYSSQLLLYVMEQDVVYVV